MQVYKLQNVHFMLNIDNCHTCTFTINSMETFDCSRLFAYIIIFSTANMISHHQCKISSSKFTKLLHPT